MPSQSGPDNNRLKGGPKPEAGDDILSSDTIEDCHFDAWLRHHVLGSKCAEQPPEVTREEIERRFEDIKRRASDPNYKPKYPVDMSKIEEFLRDNLPDSED